MRIKGVKAVFKKGLMIQKSLASIVCLITISWIVTTTVGCDNSKPAQDNTSQVSKDSKKESSGKKEGSKKQSTKDKYKELAAQFPPMLNGWEKPSATLILSGEQHGYLEPCGCSETQSGGVSRRADLFKQLKDKQWPVTAIDLGGTLKRDRRQSKIKFETIRNSLHKMGYSLMGLGPEELVLGADYLLALMPNANDPKAELPFVSSNVVLFGSPDLGTPSHFRVLQVGDLKIAVTSVLGEKYRSEIFPEGAAAANEGILDIKDPKEALAEVIPKMKEQSPDYLVLLSHAPVVETKEILKSFPDFQVAITAGGPEDPGDEPEMVGKTMMLRVGKKGKQVGVLGLYPENKENPFKYELIELDMFRFEKTQAMEDFMRLYQEQLRDEEIAENMQPVSHPSGAEFVGAKTCGQCHTKAYEKLRHTRHSHAFESLVKGRKGTPKGEWVPRIHDPECLSCHVTGWNPQEVYPYKTGFVSSEKTPHLEGQTCENCHGPGSRHVKYEEIWKKDRKKTDELMTERKAMHLSVATAEQQVCTKCHDLENSPKFEFKKYWKEISHPYRD